MRGWVAGAAGIATLGVAMAARERERRADAAWEQAVGRPGPEVELRGEPARLPAAYHGSSGFSGVFGADARRIAAVLPTDALHPVLLPGGRAAVLVGGYHHPEPKMAIGDGRMFVARPYGEVTIAVLVTPKPAPPVAPLFARERFAMGAFVLHMPVTSLMALDAGRLWAMPKFVADMTFTEDPGDRSVELSEGGRMILKLRVRPAGFVRRDRAPQVLYSVRGEELLRTTVPAIGLEQIRMGRAGGRLELGDHEVAAMLRALDLSLEPFATGNEPVSTFLIPQGDIVGSAKPYLGYGGVERQFGRYLVGHAGMPPVDQYAHRDGLERWIVPAQEEAGKPRHAPKAHPDAATAS